jgi:hypothetical protein
MLLLWEIFDDVLKWGFYELSRHNIAANPGEM